MHSNESILRDGYAAFAANDIVALVQNLTDDCVWHIRGHVPGITRDRWGHDDILDFIGQLFQLLDDFSLHVLSVFADDRHGVVLLMQEGSAAGRSIDSLCSHVFRFRDGKICEGWFLFDQVFDIDEAMVAAAERLNVTA